jgi:hypothetical protein
MFVGSAIATVNEVRGLAAIVHEQLIPVGADLAADPGFPALYHVVSGGLRVERPPAGPVHHGPGQTLGVGDVLTGESAHWKATATADAVVLRVSGHDLFEWLTDHVSLLQSLFGAVLASSRVAPVTDQSDVGGDEGVPEAELSLFTPSDCREGTS